MTRQCNTAVAREWRVVLVAVTRSVSRSLARCELTHLARAPIDLARARDQHRLYESALERLGCRVERLDEEPELPDAVFVEDTALVLDEVAVVLRPGAPSRRGETDSVASALARHRPLVRFEGPGCVDGGDVLRLGRTLRVGRSGRSDAAGVAELARLVAPYGYRVQGTSVRGCLHLKSAVTQIADDTLLVQPDWIDGGDFAGFRQVEVDPRERYGANALRVGESLVYPTSFPATAERLERLGFALERVEADELAKAEGAVTCCSLLFAATVP